MNQTLEAPQAAPQAPVQPAPSQAISVDIYDQIYNHSSYMLRSLAPVPSRRFNSICTQATDRNTNTQQCIIVRSATATRSVEEQASEIPTKRNAPPIWRI